MNFNLENKIVIITGGAGLLGVKHAEAVAEIGGIPILLDINEEQGNIKALEIKEKFNVESVFYKVNIGSEKEIVEVSKKINQKFNKVDVLINNAANNPKMEDKSDKEWSRLENFPIEIWNNDLLVGLTGAFLCSKIFGNVMAENNKGVILNISSDLGIIAPDQRIYRKENREYNLQPVKPVTYSVIKHGLIGLTKYLATYWCEKGIRVNALCPGGVFNNQPEDFVEKLTNLIPLGRMANIDEYKGAVQFLCSDASSYMTGSCLIIDGGRTCW